MGRMQSRPTRWVCEPYDVGLAERLAAGLGVSRPVGAVLARRGFAEVDEARRFLAAEERHDPLGLPGVPQACELILAHLRRGSRIAVFGDYDVDGVCSTAMLVRALRALGGDPAWELPSRFDEGYGLSSTAVERLASRGVDLLVTVDCGITAVEQVEAAKAAGLDVVVTDHHRRGEVMPSCVVVHPALGAYGCPALCASGVALKLSEALHGAAGGDPRAADEDLDLAALATVCDLVPLRDENRRIVREGLVALSRTRKPGLRALMAVGGVVPAEITEHALGFRLGPRINAAGRMRRADAALNLLLTEDGARAEEVARELDLLNRDRQEAETRILFAAEAACLPQASQAGEALAPPDLIAVERVDAVVPGGVLGLGLAEELETLRPFGMGNPQPTLLVPAARFQHVTGMGEEGEHARFTLVTAGGARSRGVAFGSPPKALAPASADNHDIALRLERNRWNGMVEPRVILRALCPTRAGELRVLGEDGTFWERLERAPAPADRALALPDGAPALPSRSPALPDLSPSVDLVRLRGTNSTLAAEERDAPSPSVELAPLRGTNSTLASGERDSAGGEGDAVGEGDATGEGHAVEDRDPVRGAHGPVDRRGEGFAGVAGDLFTSGEAVLVAVADVPRRREGLEAIVAGLAPDGMPVASWGAIAADPALVDSFRALRALAPAAPRDQLERALRGDGRYPRTAELCTRLLRVLSELRLVEVALEEPASRVLPGARAELELSPTYRACRERLGAIERALGPELPAPREPVAARAA